MCRRAAPAWQHLALRGLDEAGAGLHDVEGVAGVPGLDDGCAGLDMQGLQGGAQLGALGRAERGEQGHLRRSWRGCHAKDFLSMLL